MLLDSSLGVRLVCKTNQYIPYLVILYARSHSVLGFVLGRAARFRNRPTYNIYYNNIREVTQCSWSCPWVCGSFPQQTSIYHIFEYYMRGHTMLLDLSLNVRLVFTTNRHILYIRIIYARSHNALGLVQGCAARFNNYRREQHFIKYQIKL